MFFIVCLCLAGCSNSYHFQNGSYIKAVAPSMSVDYKGSSAMDKDGLFLFMWSDEWNTPLTYMSPDQKPTIVCWNPGCSHSKITDPDCPALFLEYGTKSVLGYMDNSVFVLQDSLVYNLENGQEASAETLLIWELNLEARTKAIVWEYSFELDPLWHGGISQFMVWDHYLYVLRTENKRPDFTVNEDGTIYAPDSEMNRYILEIDLNTKKTVTLYSIMGRFSDLLLIGMTKDYILLTEFNADTQLRHYKRLSLRTLQLDEVMTCGVREGLVFPDASHVVYTEKQEGKTVFYLKELNTQSVEILGETRGEYNIVFFEAYQSQLFKAGFISVTAPDNYLLQNQLFFDWIDGVLRKPGEGQMIQEKAYSDEVISVQYGSYELMDKVLIVDWEEAHERIAGLLPIAEIPYNNEGAVKRMVSLPLFLNRLKRLNDGTGAAR